MGKFTYKPQAHDDTGSWHASYDSLHDQHTQLYTQDLSIARQAVDDLKRRQQTHVVAAKGKNESADLTEAKAALDPVQEAETDMLLSHQAYFHSQRAQEHLDMARRAGQKALNRSYAGTNTQAAKRNPAATAPVMGGDKKTGPSLSEAVDYHSDLGGDALHCASSISQARGSMPAPKEDTPVEDLRRYHEAQDVMEMQSTHYFEMARLHRNALSEISGMLMDRGTNKNDLPDGYDPEIGISGGTATNAPTPTYDPYGN